MHGWMDVFFCKWLMVELGSAAKIQDLNWVMVKKNTDMVPRSTTTGPGNTDNLVTKENANAWIKYKYRLQYKTLHH